MLVDCSHYYTPKKGIEMVKRLEREGFADLHISSIKPAALSASVISLSVAPRFILMMSWVGSTCVMFVRLRFTLVTALGPVMSMKLLSTRSTTTQFLPVSRPATFTHILPISIAGIFNPRHFDYENPCLYFTHTEKQANDHSFE
jgi:hypothetical protein